MQVITLPIRNFSDLSVLLPAYNEEQTIGRTIEAFKGCLPGAQFWVCDNNSSDRTAAVARAHGANVIREMRQGKGYAVTRLFAEADGDYFLLADADMTYDPAAAPLMYAECKAHGYDMVTGIRNHTDAQAYRAGHVVGNRCFSWLFSTLFNSQSRDIFSGYRMFSRRFIKSFPVTSSGFEIETELSALAATLRVPTGEMDCDYHARPVGSVSKLRTYQDGFRILTSLLRLFCQYRPMAFFGVLAAILVIAGLAVGLPVIYEFWLTGRILHFPSAILASGIMVIAFTSLVAGLLLDGIKRISVEQRQLAYLALQGVRR